MKKLLLLACIAVFGNTKAQTYAQSNLSLVSLTDPETSGIFFGNTIQKYSGCWGWWQDSTTKSASKIYSNKEYALLGSTIGTYFLDISNPATPVVCDYVVGKTPSIWREVKTYQHYAYVVSDQFSPNSLQIIDLQYLPDSVHVVYNSDSYFRNSHTIWIDKDKMYCGIVTHTSGPQSSMEVYSLATPTAPVLLRTLNQDYPSIQGVHDMFVRNDTVYASCQYQGLHIYKLTSSNTFTALGSLTSYPESGYNHSSSLTQDGKTLIFCDEVPAGLSIKAADVSNLSNVTVNSLFRPNLNTGFIAHNPYVKGNQWAVVSCYQDGINIYDISNPFSPVLSAYFDTYPQGGANAGNNYSSDPYKGNWGAYPYFKSGLILALDMQNGAFLLQPSIALEAKESAKDNMWMTVYPNPASNVIQISMGNYNLDSYTLEITNLLGQVVLRESESGLTGGSYSKKTDISGISNGVYLISLSSGSKNFQQKIVISR